MSESAQAEPVLLYAKRYDRAAWREAAAVVIAATALLISLQLYLQNVHIATTNGLWKSIDVRRWIEHPSWGLLDDANVLYFPAQMVSCELLERLGIFRGEIWRQLALLNGLFGGIGAAAVYLFLSRWLRSRPAALLGTVLYAGSGFYLLLSVIDEDIMPGAVLVLIATLLACAWFARPTAWRIFIVATIFTIGWLWEWRLIFPTLPAMLLAVFIARGCWWQRLVRPTWFLGAMLPVPLLIATGFWVSRADSVEQAAHLVVRMFWAGKGVGSGWGGFSWTKVVFCWIGMAESVLGTRNVGNSTAWHVQPVAFETYAGTLVLIGLAAILWAYAWRRRSDPTTVSGFAILGGTLLAGTVFNLYSQPQDPQMVINVMIWTVPGWGLLAYGIVELRIASPAWGRAVALARPVLLVIALAPAAYNVSQLAAQRGADPIWESLARRLTAQFDPSRTVYLYQGFEGIITWQSVLLPHQYVQPQTLHAPAATIPTFKSIDATTATILNPSWNGEQVATAIKQAIDASLDLGYQVVAGPSYLGNESAWIGSFATVAKPEVPKAIWNMITANYTLTPVFHDSNGGEYAIVTRRQSSP